MKLQCDLILGSGCQNGMVQKRPLSGNTWAVNADHDRPPCSWPLRGRRLSMPGSQTPATMEPCRQNGHAQANSARSRRRPPARTDVRIGRDCDTKIEQTNPPRRIRVSRDHQPSGHVGELALRFDRTGVRQRIPALRGGDRYQPNAPARVPSVGTPLACASGWYAQTSITLPRFPERSPESVGAPT